MRRTSISKRLSLTLILALSGIAAVADWPNNNPTKWVQYPVTTAAGLDAADMGLWTYAVADDFLCSSNGPITDIHLWGGWLNDQMDPNAVFALGIYADVPISATNKFSHPGAPLWFQTFGPGQYTVRSVYTNQEAMVISDQVYGYSTRLWQYNFYPTNPFVQLGSAQTPIIYWLAVQQVSQTTGGFGWKISTNHWNDSAVFGGDPWKSLSRIDLAFALTTGSPCPAADPPVAKIILPTWGGVCDPVKIIGSAFDPAGLGINYTLEFRPAAGGAWTSIASGVTAVVNDFLALWNAAGLSEGYYLLRLTVNNSCRLSANDEVIVYLCNEFDTLTVRSPVAGSVVGASACIDGTAYDNWCFCGYTVDYSPAGMGTFLPVDPAHPVYTNTVINDPLATWDIHALPDGNYDLRVIGTDCCGHVLTRLVGPVVVDNTAPTTIITSPHPCTRVDGRVVVQGTVADAHWGQWLLQYSGGDAHGWVTIASGSSSITNGVLAVWDTSALRPCSYVLRLLATDRSSLWCGPAANQSEYLVTVTTQNCPTIPPSLSSSISGNAATISLTGETNVTYIVEYTPVLPPTNGWTSLGSFLLTENPMRVIDYSISDATQRFYRARAP